MQHFLSLLQQCITPARRCSLSLRSGNDNLIAFIRAGMVDHAFTTKIFVLQTVHNHRSLPVLHLQLTMTAAAVIVSAAGNSKLSRQSERRPLKWQQSLLSRQVSRAAGFQIWPCSWIRILALLNDLQLTNGSIRTSQSCQGTSTCQFGCGQVCHVMLHRTIHWKS